MTRIIFSVYWAVCGAAISTLFVLLMSTGNQDPFSQHMPFLIGGIGAGLILGALFFDPFRTATRPITIVLMSAAIALLAWPIVGLFGGLIIQGPEVASGTLSYYEYAEKSIVLGIMTGAFGIGTFFTVIGWIYLALVIASGAAAYYIAKLSPAPKSP